jgi:hypothetical protein
VKRILYIALTGLLTFQFYSSSAQDTLSSVPRPRIGLGTGTFSYYGEIQNYNKNFSPIVNRYGGLVYVNAPVSRHFNLEFSASYGRFAANERTLERNFNFESRIRMGTVFLYYNFYPLFTARRSYFHPFIGAGVSSFEFLSKTDLIQDTSGLTYYYWTDGSIMNMAQNDPMAAFAQPLERDYTYETDLREQNYDSLGKYREQSFGFPVSFGFELHLSPRWDFRLSSTYYFTLTDLIDNISPAGTGIRQGDKSMDRMLHTSVSLSYDLRFGTREDEMLKDDDVPLLADWDQNDWDHDGVIDALDNCAGTPLESLVDEFGCPKDADRDGVPDYNDDEPATPLGNYVDEFGVTITKEQFDRHWELFNDSTGYGHDFAEQRTTVVFWKDDRTTFTGQKPTAPAGKSYVIIVGKEHKDVNANELHKYLGYNNYKTILRGDTVYYVLGEYAKIEDAVAARTELDSLGIKVELIGRDNKTSGVVTAVDSAIVEKVEQVNQQEGRYSTDFSVKHQTYKVQIGAFKNKPDVKTQFPGIETIFGTGEDGITRYYSGSFSTYEEAEAYRKELAAKGYKNAFVVGYEGSDRKTLIELGVDSTKLPTNYNEQQELSTFVEPRDSTPTIVTPGKIDMTKVKYRVKMAYAVAGGNIPVETLKILQEIGGIKNDIQPDGTTYYSQAFNSPGEMESAILDYKSYGLDGLTGVVEYEGKYYTLEEFNKLLQE